MSNKITRQEAETRLITKAWEDKAFRKQLLKDPKKTAEKELGVQFEADAKIVVLEETPKSWHLVLPLRPDRPPDVTEQTVLVRDKAGTFYEIPASSLSEYAVSDAGALEAAARAWESDEAEVEGQVWLFPRPVRTPCPCSLRG